MGWLECDFWDRFLGPPKASGFCFQSERLLYGREPNHIKGGTGKQRPKLQDAGISPKQWPKKMCGRKRLLTDSTKVSTTGGPRQHAKRKKRSRMYARGYCQLEELHRREGGTVSYRWDWTIRGEERTRGNGQRGSRDVAGAPWKSPMMAWSTVCDDYFWVAD